MVSSSRIAAEPIRSETIVVPDILAHGLRVVFCGLNPGLSSAAQGRPFANPTNRFWKVIHLAGFTPLVLNPAESRRLLSYGCGLTTAVRRPTVTAGDLETREFGESAESLRARVREYAPKHIAFMGKAAYRVIERRSSIEWGEQSEPFADARAWVCERTDRKRRRLHLPRAR